MTYSISNLPPELVENILSRLELHDVCNLRLVDHATDIASTQAHFKSFCESKTLHLSRDALAKFIAGTDHNRFARVLRDLNLNPPSTDLSIEDENTADANMLYLAFLSIHNQSEQRCLRSLDVEVPETETLEVSLKKVYFGVQANPRYAAGTLAVRATLRALNDSDLRVEKLNLLYNSVRCSVPCDVFENPFGSALPSATWSHVRCLSLSLANHEESASSARASSPTDAAIQRLQNLISFFSLISHVEELNLHWYNSRGMPSSDADLVEQQWFDHVSQAVSFDNLRSLTLRGLHVSHLALQKVLMVPSLESVHLEEIHLGKEGALRPLLDCLTAPNRALNSFYLDDIWEHRLVHFLIKGTPKFPFADRKLGPTTVRRVGSEVTLPLGYRISNSRSLGSPMLNKLIMQRRRDFG
ncbi:hypothetical protein E4T43_05459 [Aureobasidium subglaciale]|nr:hypothetical protein E4T43_05459 [Aureobasidium subglaciale]